MADDEPRTSRRAGTGDPRDRRPGRASLARRTGDQNGRPAPARAAAPPRWITGVVVERTRAVARLVTSETILRDVVVYQNRLLGSTKRSLVVVTGKVLSGFDLDRGTEVRVDHDAKVVRVVLPPAAVMAVEVTDLKTYDEQRGLWNPFRPADRDTIFRLAREQLVKSAGEVELARHTEESARRLLEALVSADGYTTEVVFSPSVTPTQPRE